MNQHSLSYSEIQPPHEIDFEGEEVEMMGYESPMRNIRYETANCLTCNKYFHLIELREGECLSCRKNALLLDKSNWRLCCCRKTPRIHHVFIVGRKRMHDLSMEECACPICFEEDMKLFVKWIGTPQVRYV